LSDDRPEGLPRRQVAAAVIVEGGLVLVQTRAGPGRYQGYWEFPGGGREGDESPEACVERELLEELGLAVTVLEPFDQVEWAYPGVEVCVDFLLCELASPAERPRALEGQEFRWAAVDELAGLRFLPTNASVIERLRALLGPDGPG